MDYCDLTKRQPLPSVKEGRSCRRHPGRFHRCLFRRPPESQCFLQDENVEYVFIYIHSGVCMHEDDSTSSTYSFVGCFSHSSVPSFPPVPLFLLSSSSRPAPSVPSLVRFDFFHLLANPYFCSSLSYHRLHCFLSFLLSVCVACVHPGVV